MRLVLTCPACGKSENHICQDELSEHGLWVVDTFAIAGGARPVDAPGPEEYRKMLLSKASGLERPRAVLTLMEHEGPRLVVAEGGPRPRRESLFLGFVAGEAAGATTWLYVYTGLHGLLCLTSGPMGLREMILAEGAVLPVKVGRDGAAVVLQPVSALSVQDKLPDPGSFLLPDELAALRAFVDKRIEALS